MALRDDVLALSVAIDATYPDSDSDPSRKSHQQNHDTVHAALKDILLRVENLESRVTALETP